MFWDFYDSLWFDILNGSITYVVPSRFFLKFLTLAFFIFQLKAQFLEKGRFLLFLSVSSQGLRICQW